MALFMTEPGDDFNDPNFHVLAKDLKIIKDSLNKTAEFMAEKKDQEILSLFQAAG